MGRDVACFVWLTYNEANTSASGHNRPFSFLFLIRQEFCSTRYDLQGRDRLTFVLHANFFFFFCLASLLFFLCAYLRFLLREGNRKSGYLKGT